MKEFLGLKKNLEMSEDKSRTLPQDNNVDEKLRKEIAHLIEEELSEAVGQEKMLLQRFEEIFSGPLPHPKHLREYKNIDKTYPDRIMSMAEKSQEHKIFIQRTQAIGDFVVSLLGWATPTGIAAYSLYQAAELVRDGKNIESFIALITALGTIGGSFYISKRLSTKDSN